MLMLGCLIGRPKFVREMGPNETFLWLQYNCIKRRKEYFRTIVTIHDAHGNNKDMNIQDNGIA